MSERVRRGQSILEDDHNVIPSGEVELITETTSTSQAPIENIDSIDSVNNEDNGVVSDRVNAEESSSRFHNSTFKERVKTKGRPKRRSKGKDQGTTSKCLFRK